MKQITQERVRDCTTGSKLFDSSLVNEVAKILDEGSPERVHQVLCAAGLNDNRRPRLSWVRIAAPKGFNSLHELWEKYDGLVPHDPGYVYLVYAEGSPYFKIGKTNNPKRRIWKEISPVMPFECQLVKLWPTNHMTWAEKTLHEEYEHRRGKGEWFRLTNSDLSYLLCPSQENYINDHAGNKIWDSFQLKDDGCPWDEWVKLHHIANLLFPDVIGHTTPSSSEAIQGFFQDITNQYHPLSLEIQDAVNTGRTISNVAASRFLDDSVQLLPDIDILGGAA